MADETEGTKAEERLGQAETEEHAEQEEPEASEESDGNRGPADGPASLESQDEPRADAEQSEGPEDGDEADAEQGAELQDDTEPADGSEENDEPTEPVTESVSPQQRIIDTAQRAAQAGTASVTEGVSAVRELSAARRAHATAFKELETLERDTKRLAEQLEHRRDVESNYERIVEVQTAEIEDAGRALERARVRRANLESQLEGKNNELKRLKEANSQKMAPSRKLMEQAKDALAKAERAQAEARRALKNAQAQADEATASRDSKLQAAKRAADTASAKLARQQDQLTDMRRDPSAGAKRLSQASSSVAAALAQLENARENVARVNQETGQAVQIAQTHLYTQRKSLEEA